MRNKLLYSFIIIVTVVITTVFMVKFSKQAYLYTGDAFGYYDYLPATLIYHNLKSIYQLPADKGIPPEVISYAAGLKDGWLHTPKGYVLDQYTYGVALMELPFFLIAHGYEKLTGLPANGYSSTYCYMMVVCSMVYTFLGLLLTFLVLKRYFKVLHSLLAVALIFLATNIFWFAVYQPGMSHTPLFFLYALLVYLSIKVHEQPKVLYFLLIGFIAGLITIIRPTDILCVFIPLLYGVYNRDTLRKKFAFISANRQKFIFLFIAFLIPIIPQLVYWKELTGSWLFYSYGDQQFFWTHPKIIAGLFYFRNGWFPYAPIMLFAVVGLLLYKHYKVWILPIAVILPFYVYVIYSWYCYNYINGLGSRPMIHMYPLLAIPLAAVIQFVARKGVVVKALFSLVCVFFISVMYSFGVLKAKRLLNSEESNFYFCAEMLYKSSMTYNDLVCADTHQWQPDTAKLVKIRTLGFIDFEDSLSPHYVSGLSTNGKYLYHITEDEEHPPFHINVVYNKDSFQGANWLKCSGKFMLIKWVAYDVHALVLQINHKDDVIKWVGCKFDDKIGLVGNDTTQITIDHIEHNLLAPVYFFVPIPSKIKDGDVISYYIWNLCKQEAYADDFCLELYKSK